MPSAPGAHPVDAPDPSPNIFKYRTISSAQGGPIDLNLSCPADTCRFVCSSWLTQRLSYHSVNLSKQVRPAHLPSGIRSSVPTDAAHPDREGEQHTVAAADALSHEEEDEGKDGEKKC